MPKKDLVPAPLVKSVKVGGSSPAADDGGDAWVRDDVAVSAEQLEPKRKDNARPSGRFRTRG